MDYKIGQKYEGAGNLVVTIDNIADVMDGSEIIDYKIYYSWIENGVKKTHSKYLFSFLTRYPTKLLDI